MRTEYVEAVLALVELVPPGAAVAYGDVAELLGSGGARQVGSVMSHHGSGVPWWRVLRANGEAPQGLEAEALQFYVQEGTPLLGRYAGLPPDRRRTLARGPYGSPLGPRRR